MTTFVNISRAALAFAAVIEPSAPLARANTFFCVSETISVSVKTNANTIVNITDTHTHAYTLSSPLRELHAVKRTGTFGPTQALRDDPVCG